MDRKGREILAGSWRGQHQLLQIDYGSGAIISDIEPDRQNSYVSCLQVDRFKYLVSIIKFKSDSLILYDFFYFVDKIRIFPGYV